MVKQTLGGLQEDLYDDASVLLALADILDPVIPINLRPDDDDEPDPDLEVAKELLARGQSEVAAVLRMYGAMCAEDAELLKGDGTRGPYFQVRKSEDWFISALQMPDRQFRAVFRYGLVKFCTASCLHFSGLGDELLILSVTYSAKTLSLHPVGANHSTIFHGNLVPFSFATDNLVPPYKILASS